MQFPRTSGGRTAGYRIGSNQSAGIPASPDGSAPSHVVTGVEPDPTTVLARDDGEAVVLESLAAVRRRCAVAEPWRAGMASRLVRCPSAGRGMAAAPPFRQSANPVRKWRATSGSPRRRSRIAATRRAREYRIRTPATEPDGRCAGYRLTPARSYPTRAP